MRTEQIVNEAKMYNSDEECYIHVEKVRGANYKMMIAGEASCIAQAAYNIMSYIEEHAGIPVDHQLKIMRKIYKKSGRHTPTYRIPVGGQNETD